MENFTDGNRQYLKKNSVRVGEGRDFIHWLGVGVGEHPHPPLRRRPHANQVPLEVEGEYD